MTMGCYDRKGELISTLRWGRLYSDSAYRFVAREEVGAHLVSTVWLGLDYSMGEGPPLIFETMVFAGDTDERDCQRYSTEAEALAGHDAMVTLLRATDQTLPPQSHEDDE